MRFHARLSDIAFNKPTDGNFRCTNYSEFRALNGHPAITVGNHATYGNRMGDMSGILEDSPSGGTPLCRHIREVIAKVTTLRADLERNGQKAVLMIATDGESSDGDLAAAMAPLKHLPVWVVVRLCTDQSSIVDYWNNIDENLELDMDVLDDLGGEEEEIRKVNPWLTYGPALHLMREFGVSNIKEFDLIDEQRLNFDQIYRVVRAILGGDYPHPDVDMTGFIQCVNSSNREIFSCRSNKMMPLIQTSQLNNTTIKNDNLFLIALMVIVLAIIAYNTFNQ